MCRTSQNLICLSQKVRLNPLNPPPHPPPAYRPIEFKQHFLPEMSPLQGQSSISKSVHATKANMVPPSAAQPRPQAQQPLCAYHPVGKQPTSPCPTFLLMPMCQYLFCCIHSLDCFSHLPSKSFIGILTTTGRILKAIDNNTQSSYVPVLHVTDQMCNEYSCPLELMHV